jgi:hypothetical protein
VARARRRLLRRLAPDTMVAVEGSLATVLGLDR